MKDELTVLSSRRSRRTTDGASHKEQEIAEMDNLSYLELLNGFA